MIHWLVVQCKSVGRKFGGPQALPPRRDVAYFVDKETAERDAKAFAAYKNGQERNDARDFSAAEAYSNNHAAFAWDHNIFNPLIQWAVLEWNGEGAEVSVRNDVAYFLDKETGETDAKAFRVMRDELQAHKRVA